MKITVEMDCTPEEARAFLGLPDLRPMQQAVIERMQTRMNEAADTFSPDSLLRTWMTLVPEGQLRTMVESFFGAFMPRARGAEPPPPPTSPAPPP
ncbi:MAG TPA: DUF6489 family protein [Acidisphaera sp.]|nr:DUF6489 family protein [Acidisphaera sp.]